MPKKPNANSLPYIISGLAILVILFGGLTVWASFAPLSGAVIAPAVVAVYSKRKTIQHLEGGIVAEIFVKDGDYVEKDQLLIRLEDTQAKARTAILDGQLAALRARKARLSAERDGQEQVGFPKSLTEAENDPEVTELLRSESELFNARRAALRGEIDILKERITQLKTLIRGLSAQKESKARQIVLIDGELSGLRKLYENGYATKTRMLALERLAESLSGERGEHIAEIARAESSIGEAELSIIQVTKRMHQDVVQELQEVQNQIFDLEERRIAAVDELYRVEVRAPQAGTVVGLDVHTPGGVIAPGQEILDIVPDNDELVVEAQVSPQDIDKVADGLQSMVRFTAFNLRTTPDLNGSVFMASADRIYDERSNVPHYLVGIRIDQKELAKLDDLQLLPGMPAEVFIETGERTALSYFLKPLTDGLARAFKDD